MPKPRGEDEAHYLCQVSIDLIIRSISERSLATYAPSQFSVGPVSSLHDRACELFYLLVGGTGTFIHLLPFSDRCD